MNRSTTLQRALLAAAAAAIVPALASGTQAPAKPAAPGKPAIAAPAARASSAVPQPAPQRVQAVTSGVVPPAAVAPKAVLPPTPPPPVPLPPPPVAAAPAPATVAPTPAVNTGSSPKAFIQSRYNGELADEELKPISGVFKVLFRLYPDAGAAKEIWSEAAYVAIVEGSYEVLLGGTSPIGANLDGRQLFLSATINEEEGERAPYAVASASTRDESPGGPVFRGKSFADIADRALVANRAGIADNCSTLGGKTAEEIDQSKELNKRVSELREALREKSSVKLGTQQQVLERVGGSGGNPYQRQCPPGYVVTGFRGGQGQFLDSIEVVCNAIE